MILSVIIGVVIFLSVMALVVFSVLKIKSNEKLKKTFKWLCGLGGLQLAIMFISNVSQMNEVNKQVSILFVNYLQAMYIATISVGLVFIILSSFNKIKTALKSYRRKTA